MAKKQSKNLIIVFFAFFTIMAISIALLLEYIDFKKGKESIIFKKSSKSKGPDNLQVDLNKKIESFFNKNQLSYSSTDKGGVFRFKIEIKPGQVNGVLAQINNIVVNVNGSFTLAQEETKGNETLKLYKIELQKRVSHWILIATPSTDPPILKKAKTQPKGPRLAIIIDDIGNRPQMSKVLKKLNIPITGSILPHSPFALEEAEQLKAFNLEALIHIPMQPKNSGSRFARDRYITQNSTNTEIRSLIKRAKAVIPNALGCNNHEGSLVTSNPQLMRRVLTIMQNEGLFFVDSRTSISTVAFKLAKEMKLKTASRDVFLDDPKTYENSMDEMKRLVDLAVRNGKAIAIGHPFESTLQAIHDSIPYIRSRGVKIVFVSQLLE